jgi:hypothetical protein
MIKLELEEDDVFKLMAGSLEDRIQYFISDEIMNNIDLQTIKDIVEAGIAKAQTKSGSFNDDSLTDLIKLFQYIVYNRNKSQYSEEIATYIFDKIFELISCDFW